MTPSDLEADTADATFDRSVVFETSGTTGEAKRVPYTSRDLVRQAQLGEDAFELLGLGPDDAILNLGAPEPHISGLLLEIAAMETGVSTYNRSLADYEQVLEGGHAEKITTVIGQPLFVRSLADELTTDERSAKDLFPNVEKVISTGANLLPPVEAELRRLWGADTIQEAYASTEFGCIAVRPDMDDRYVPMSDYHEFELLPSDADGPESLVAIEDIEEPTTGSLVISTGNREAYSFDRYEIGDGARVVPTDDGPRLEILGRTDNAVQFGAIVLYEGEVVSALDAAYGESVENWRAVVDVNDVGEPGVTVYVTGDGIENRSDEFRTALVEQSSAVSTVDDFGIIDHIDVSVVDSLADCEWADDDFEPRPPTTAKTLFRAD
ncbi:AMP-binding protein [Halorussus lipolyticus]|uniref:AMP-binding protein n=1 Tax=Halorussus lipolyticus TaxID=3034024 RepID=UPI0023E82C04|nr:AMP-binding protein [Halorussus sp. DT80]